MILDKAPETVRAYHTNLVDDGYGTLVPEVALTFVDFKAFIIPVGFSGAGWAINSKLQAQGWADVARDRVIWKPSPTLAFINRWTRFEYRGQRFTVQEEPGLLVGTRPSQTVIMVVTELEGNL